MADTNMRIVIDGDSKGAVTAVKSVSGAMTELTAGSKSATAGLGTAGVSADNVGRTFSKSGKVFKSTGKFLKSSGLDAAASGTAFLSTIPALSGMSSAAGGLVLGLESLSQVAGSLGPAGLAGMAGLAVAAGAAYVIMRDRVGAAESAIRQMNSANLAAAASHRAATKAAWDQSGAELALKSAVLAEKESALRLRDAHAEVRRALKENGRGSSEYKRALLDEQRAELDLTGAKRARVEATRESTRQSQATRKELRQEVADAEKAVAVTGKQTLANRLGVIQGKDAEKAAKAHAEALKRLAAAQTALAADTTATTTTVGGLKAQMDRLKSRALKIDVDTEQALFNVIRLVGQMALVASKSITLTVNTKHVRGSWNDQETIENLRKEPKRRAFQIDFRSMGTAAVENSLKMTKQIIAALKQAKANAASMASDIGSSIGQILDAQASEAVKLLDQSPEAVRLRTIEKNQKQSQAASERAGLDAAIKDAQTPEERQAAVRALDEWLIEQERQTLEETLALKRQNIADEATARSTATTRNLNDLQDALNRGLISQKSYNVAFQGVLEASGIEYNRIGTLLGSQFATGFSDQVSAILGLVGKITAPKPTVLSGAGPDKPPAKKKVTVKLPSHATGIDYVPRTGPALIHSGEAVLNRQDAAAYRAGLGSGGSVEVTLRGGLEHLTDLIDVRVNSMAEGARRRSMAAGGIR